MATSPDSRWVVSACRNHALKLWAVDSGREAFSMRVDGEVRHLKFTADSQYLVGCTGSQTSRMLVFKLHAGTSG
jgi:WD40 repeat protein